MSIKVNPYCSELHLHVLRVLGTTSLINKSFIFVLTILQNVELIRFETRMLSWILSLWGQIFALISGKCYLVGLVFYPLKDIQSSHKLYSFLFYLTKFISEIYRNLEAPKPLESQAYLITAILDNSAESVPKNWEWV